MLLSQSTGPKLSQWHHKRITNSLEFSETRNGLLDITYYCDTF